MIPSAWLFLEDIFPSKMGFRRKIKRDNAGAGNVLRKYTMTPDFVAISFGKID